MKVNDETVFAQLEIVAAQFPWDEIHASVRRKPEGIYTFQFYMPSNEKTGAEWCFGNGDSIEEAAADLVRNAGERDPEVKRRQKIAELQLEIEKLKNKSFMLPPYRAPGQLGFGEPAHVRPPQPKFNDPINV
jgi:hypothetical protein